MPSQPSDFAAVIGLDWADRKHDKNEIDITRDLAIGTFFFGPAEYKSLKTFFDKVKEGDDEQVLLKQVAHVAQN